MALAYIDRKKEKEINSKKYEEMMKQIKCCSLSKLKFYMTNIYNSFQKYTHCEIIFLSESTIRKKNINCLAFAAIADQGLVRIERTFSNPAYRYIFFNVSKEEYNNAKKFCESQVGKQYDFKGASWRLLVWPISGNNNCWWCASFVHACLKKIGKLKYYEINTLDVDDIVDLVNQQNERKTENNIAFTPYQLKIATDTTVNDLFSIQ